MSDVPIGPIANIGPGGKYHGRIVGLKPVGDIAIAGGAAALGAVVSARRSKLQEYNDEDAEHIVGSAGGGKPVRDQNADDPRIRRTYTLAGRSTHGVG